MSNMSVDENSNAGCVGDATSLLQACNLPSHFVSALPAEYTYSYTPTTPPIAELRSYVAAIVPDILAMQLLPPKSEAGMLSRISSLLRLPLHLYGGSAIVGDTRDIIIVEEISAIDGSCNEAKTSENNIRQDVEVVKCDEDSKDEENTEVENEANDEVQEEEKSSIRSSGGDSIIENTSHEQSVINYSLHHHPVHSTQQLIILSPPATSVRCIVHITPYLPPNIYTYPPHYHLLHQLIRMHQITPVAASAPIFGILTDSCNFIFYKLTPITSVATGLPSFNIAMSKNVSFADMPTNSSTTLIAPCIPVLSTSPAHLSAYAYLLEIFPPSTSVAAALDALHASIKGATTSYLKQIFLEHDYSDRLAELAKQQLEVESVNKELEKQKEEIEKKKAELERLRVIENSLKE